MATMWYDFEGMTGYRFLGKRSTWQVVIGPSWIGMVVPKDLGLVSIMCLVRFSYVF